MSSAEHPSQEPVSCPNCACARNAVMQTRTAWRRQRAVLIAALVALAGLVTAGAVWRWGGALGVRFEQGASFGPWSVAPDTPGTVAVTGPNGGVQIARRDLADWPASPAAGDRFTWYNPDGGLRLSTDGTGDLLAVTSTGNVGIGTTTPGVKLDVNGGIDANGWVRTAGGTGWYNSTYGGGWYMVDTSWIRSYGSKNIYCDTIMRADGGFQVDGNQVIDADAGWHRTYGATGWYNATYGGGWYMTDTNYVRSYNGKRVRIDGSDNTLAMLLVRNAGGDGKGIKIDAGSAGNTNALPLHIQDYGNTTDFMYINGAGDSYFAGNMKLGTSSNTYKLNVNGDAAKTGGGSWQTLSDERLKDISGPFEAGLEEVSRLQPIRYRYRGDNPLGIPDEGEHVGFSAQEVEQVIPEAVSTGDHGYRMLDQDAILWAMLNAIKQLKAENEALRARLEKLENPAGGH